MNQSDKAKDVRRATSDGLQRIYLIIVGLAIAQALIRTFTDQSGFAWHSLGDAAHLTQVSLLIAFLLTVIRFAHGSILHLTALADAQKWQWDMLGLLLQAVFFFITALTLTSGEIGLFLGFFAGVFILDTAWLGILKMLGVPLGKMGIQWVSSNGILLLIFLAVWLLRGRGVLPDLAVALIVAIATLVAALCDYIQNKDAYFPQ